MWLGVVPSHDVKGPEGFADIAVPESGFTMILTRVLWSQDEVLDWILKYISQYRDCGL